MDAQWKTNRLQFFVTAVVELCRWTLTEFLIYKMHRRSSTPIGNRLIRYYHEHSDVDIEEKVEYLTMNFWFFWFFYSIVVNDTSDTINCVY